MENLQRTYIYIDGFNLYYGLLKGSPYKWLDLKSLFQKLLNPTHDILAIKYYTAKISVRDDPQAPIRQASYIRALENHIPEFSVYYGHYLTHTVMLPLANNMNNKSKFVKVLKSEEKGSDVNLAVHLLNDAWLDRYDCAILVSNDSDLSESIRLAKKQHNKKIGIITPTKSKKRRTTKKLRDHADFIKLIREGVLKDSQLAKKIGTSQSVISRLESGDDIRVPSLDVLARIANATHTKINISFEDVA